MRLAKLPAMILAAGRGARMRPLTDVLPKPLLCVGGKPLLFWHIERLVAAGVERIVINTGWLGERIVEAVGDGRHLGARISYSHEMTQFGQILETAGGIATVLPLLDSDVFLVVNGDTWIDFPFASLSDPRQCPFQGAHLVLVNNPEHHPQGDFLLADGRVVGRADQNMTSSLSVAVPSFTFSGVGLYHASIFSRVAPGVAHPLLPVLLETMALGRLSGQHYSGEWIDVGTPERLASLDTAVWAAQVGRCSHTA